MIQFTDDGEINACNKFWLCMLSSENKHGPSGPSKVFPFSNKKKGWILSVKQKKALSKEKEKRKQDPYPEITYSNNNSSKTLSKKIPLKKHAWPLTKQSHLIRCCTSLIT